MVHIITTLALLLTGACAINVGHSGHAKMHLQEQTRSKPEEKTMSKPEEKAVSKPEEKTQSKQEEKTASKKEKKITGVQAPQVFRVPTSAR